MDCRWTQICVHHWKQNPYLLKWGSELVLFWFTDECRCKLSTRSPHSMKVYGKRQKWWWTMTIIEDEAGEIHKKIGKEKEKKTNKNPDWNLETTQNPDSSKRDDESPGSPSIQLRLLLLPWAEDYELQLDKLRRAASPLLSSSPQVLCRFTPDFQLLGVLMARRMCITKWRLVGIGVTFWWSPRCRFSGDLHIGCILWGVLLVFVFDR